jgi:hypothetical protein
MRWMNTGEWTYLEIGITTVFVFSLRPMFPMGWPTTINYFSPKA